MIMSPSMPNTEPKSSGVVHVAVGVIYDARGQILLARRAAHQHQGGLWEFPGGKIELGETPEEGLIRELYEELGIAIRRCEPLIQIPYHYPDKSVVLHVWRVSEFQGEPQGREGQPLLWVEPEQLPNFEFPPANRPIVSAARLPDRLAVTGRCDNARDFEARFQRVLEQGVRLVYFRAAPEQSESRLYLDIARSLCRQVDGQLMANIMWHQQLTDNRLGLHLGSTDLINRVDWSRMAKKVPWVSASCHSPRQLQVAGEQCVDFALLAPVRPTTTHPERDPLGWSQFAQWVREATLPVYALGGVEEKDLLQAKSMGAQGIAAISAFWAKPEKGF